MFCIRHLEGDSFRFASLQGDLGRSALLRHGMDGSDLSTMIVIEDFEGAERLHQKSDAAVFLAQHFRAGWRALRFIKVLPRAVRDWFYDRVAKNRYRIFGKTEACAVPPPHVRTLFLD